MQIQSSINNLLITVISIRANSIRFYFIVTSLLRSNEIIYVGTNLRKQH